LIEDVIVAIEHSLLTLKISSPTQLSVEDAAGRRFGIHPIWLRERCQDTDSMDLLTGQRLHDPSDLDLDLSYAALSETGPGRLHVRFSDGHEADFMAGDILAEAALPPGEHDVPALEFWTGTLSKLPRAQWRPDPSDAELAGWLEPFLRYGFIIFSGVPSEHHAVLKAAAMFGFTRETNFGTVFDVRSTPNATDLAYTPVKLDPHTDNPYRSPVPGVQLLHCLANETTGGLSTLVDGYAVGEALRERDPEAFRVLSTTPVRFRYRDTTTELIASAPPIELDVSGRIKTIHFSPRLDFVPLLPPETLTAYYRARRVFDHLLRTSEFEIRFLLDRGDLVMFDNCRLLHGRTGFNPQEGLRHLQGCYIDIDGPRSAYRVLRRQFAATAGGEA
jgi:gamma-butyrobetaine dioxygenase